MEVFDDEPTWQSALQKVKLFMVYIIYFFIFVNLFFRTRAYLRSLDTIENNEESNDESEQYPNVFDHTISFIMRRRISGFDELYVSDVVEPVINFIMSRRIRGYNEIDVRNVVNKILKRVKYFIKIFFRPVDPADIEEVVDSLLDYVIFKILAYGYLVPIEMLLEEFPNEGKFVICA